MIVSQQAPNETTRMARLNLLASICLGIASRYVVLLQTIGTIGTCDTNM